MLTQMVKQFFVGERRFFGALFKGGKVFCIFSQRLTHGVINNVRHGPSAVNGLDAQGAMEFGLQINRGTIVFS